MPSIASAAPLRIQPRWLAPIAIDGPGMSRDARALLLNAATANPAGRWDAGSDIARARNAHATNTFAQLRAALSGPYDWLECDVRIRAGQIVTAHGVDDGGAMLLRYWLDIAQRTGRGVKFDIKERAALLPTVHLLQASGIPDWRIIVNVGPNVRRTHLLAARSAFPGAIFNVDPGAAPYTPARIAAAVRVARQVGGPIMFPLNAAHVTSNIVRALQSVGRIAIWNNPSQYDPGSIDAATKRLRNLGVDGMIDLRRPA